MAGPYPPHFGAGPAGPPPHPGPPPHMAGPPAEPYPDNPVAPPMYPGMLPPPIPYPKRRPWRAVGVALLALALVAAVGATIVLTRSNDESAPAKLTNATAQTAIQNYLDALQRGDTEEVARNTLCGLFDAVKEKRSDLALADLSSDAFRKQFGKAEVTSVDKMVFSSPTQAQVLFSMNVTPAGSRTRPPPEVEEQAVAQLLVQDNQVLVCSYLLRAMGQY